MQGRHRDGAVPLLRGALGRLSPAECGKHYDPLPQGSKTRLHGYSCKIVSAFGSPTGTEMRATDGR
jgi:hypothetical protein